MKNQYARYAVCWVPHPGSDLSRFGCAWTGWCAEFGNPSRRSSMQRLQKGFVGVPGETALSGIHGNIAAPFALGEGRSLWRLERVIEDVARAARPITIPEFELTVSDGRLLLVPTFPSEALTALLCRIGKALEPMRAEPGGMVDLTASARPVVRGRKSIERFAIPLSDPLETCDAYELGERIYPLLTRVLDRPAFIRDIALLGDPGEGRPWRLLQRYPLVIDPVAQERPMPSGMACPGVAPMPPLRSVMGSDWETVIG